MTDELYAEGPRVLMVDDEKTVADAYALRLEDVADVTVVYSGEAALETIDDQYPPDVVLLDRHMSGLSGDEVLQRLRDRDVRSRIIMVTAIDPGLGVLDMPFDDYLSKPVEREDIRAAVDQQCRVLAYELLGEYFSLESKRAVLEAELPPEDTTSNDRLGEIEARLSTVEERVRGLLPEADELLSSFDAIDREGY
jgi:DNA-binding response OmpR family regulator